MGFRRFMEHLVYRKMEQSCLLPANNGDASFAVSTKWRKLQMRIELRFIGRIISVRLVPRNGRTNVRLWDELGPRSVHVPTKLDYQQLRQLGEGVHEVE